MRIRFSRRTGTNLKKEMINNDACEQNLQIQSINEKIVKGQLETLNDILTKRLCETRVPGRN